MIDLSAIFSDVFSTLIDFFNFISETIGIIHVDEEVVIEYTPNDEGLTEPLQEPPRITSDGPEIEDEVGGSETDEGDKDSSENGDDE